MRDHDTPTPTGEVHPAAAIFPMLFGSASSPSNRESSQRWIYFIQAGGKDGPIKIGIASDPAERLTALQVGAHTPLRLLGIVGGTVHDERSLHRRFRAERLQGEWFRPTLDLLVFVSNQADRWFGEYPIIPPSFHQRISGLPRWLGDESFLHFPDGRRRRAFTMLMFQWLEYLGDGPNETDRATFEELAPYLALGMITGEAYTAYLRDHPELLAAD